MRGPNDAWIAPDERARREKLREADCLAKQAMTRSAGYCGTCSHLAGNGEVWEGKEQWQCSLFPVWTAVVRWHHCGQWAKKTEK